MKRRVAARIIVGWDDRNIDTNIYKFNSFL